MTGTLNIYIPRRADGERMTGVMPEGQRARATFTRSVETRSFFDPEADRNSSNAIPVTDPRHPLHPRHVAKRGPLPMIAPAGWSLRPVAPVAPEPVREVEVPAEHCGKRFRTPAGLAWHLTNIHAGAFA